MIVVKSPYIDDDGNVYANLEQRYSDTHNMLLQVETGIKYAEAIDVIPCRYTYAETDEPIPDDEEVM